jgi:hypothetical protein
MGEGRDEGANILQPLSGFPLGKGQENAEQSEAKCWNLLKQPQAWIEANTPHFHLSPLRLRSGQALGKGRENKL